MKARINMIGDFDDDSKTYAICLIASEEEVDSSGLKDGDEVEVMPSETKIDNLAHEILATSQLMPNEAIAEGIERIKKILQREKFIP